MASIDYSVVSYVTHVISGLPSGYNLMRQMLTIPGTRETLNEDSLSSHIIQDEFMQESERPAEMLPQANYVALAKQGHQQGQRGKSARGGGWKSSNAKSTEGADRGKSAKEGDRGSGGSRYYICDALDHLSYDCPDQDDSDDDRDANHRKGDGGRRRRDNLSRKEKWSSKTSSMKDAKSSGGDEALCSMVIVVEPTISLALEAVEDFKAVAAIVQANPTVVLLDNGCSHHLMGMKEAFVDMQPSSNVHHVRGFNGALKSIEGRTTVTLQGEAGKQVLVPDVLYVPGVHANLLSAGHLKENGVKLQDDGGEMLLVFFAGDVLGRARYSGRILCTDMRPCSTKLTMTSTEVVALRTIASASKLTLDMLHARLAHVGVNTIKSSAKHEVAAGLDIKKSTATDLPCASCVGGKLARHTFPIQGSDAENALDVVHIDLCGPFRVAANDGSLYFLLLKDRKTRYVWVKPIAKKSDMLSTGRRRRGHLSSPPPDSSSKVPLLAVVDEHDDEDIEEVPLPPPVVPSSAASDEGRLGALPAAPTGCIAGGRRDAEKVSDGKLQTTGELSTTKPTSEKLLAEAPPIEKSLAEVPPVGEPPAKKPILGGQSVEELLTGEQFDNDSSSDDVVELIGAVGGDEGELLTGEHTLLSDIEDDNDLLELDPHMHADREHRWDIANMTVKEALASWKGTAVKAAMDEEIKSLISNGMWELVERPRGVNIMKNCWVLTTKYYVDDTVAREKARFPLLWYSALDAVLTGADWKKSQVDEGLYFKIGDNGVVCWVLVYVDDLLAASSSTAMLKELEELPEAAFELREISPRFIDEEQTVRVPKTQVSVDAYTELMFDDEEFQPREEAGYRQKVGSLQFVATMTKPVIAFVCSKLGSGLTVRIDNHWREVDRHLHYLAKNRDTALEFGGGPESLCLVGYADADDAGDKQNWTSKGGYVFIFGGAAVSWSSRRIKCATLPLTESEYVAATEAGKEARQGLELKGNLKHMERRYTWLQQMIKRGKISPQYILNSEQPADFLTKALHFPAFNRYSVSIGQVHSANVGDGDDEVQK
ncbi:unnamed protein product [Closterium sp. NIES-54]